MKRIKIFISAIFLAFTAVCGLHAKESLDELLKGYLSNDLELRSLSSQMQNVILESEITTVSNGFSFKISSGTITFTTGDDWNIKFTPTATFAVPDAKNLGISVSSSMLFDSKDTTDTFSNTSLKVSVDIISNDSKNREITKLKTQRKVLEAQRNLQNGFVSAEKKFYETLKSLYEMAAKIVSLEKSLYDDQLSLDTLKAQGYTTSSTKYRTANMKVVNDQYEIDVQKKNMEREVKVFCAKCGVQYTETDPVNFLPEQIPDVEPVSVDSFSPSDYKKVEAASWNAYISKLEREADGNIKLTANAGFTFNNERTRSHTVDVGSNFTWNDTGLALNVGANLPVGSDSFTPVFTLGVSFDPNAFKVAKLNDQITELEVSAEELEKQNAQIDFGTAMVSQKSSLENILWEAKTCAESYDMYSSLAADMANYYRQGYVNKTEYNNAQVNKENYRLKILINKLDLLIYNDTTTLLFVRDGEFLNSDAEVEEKSDVKE